MNRRSFLLSVSASALAFLAGCKGGSEPAPADQPAAAGTAPHQCACAQGAEGGCACAECKASDTGACTCAAPTPEGSGQ